MFSVHQSKKPAQLLFEIPKARLTHDPVYNPKAAGVPLSSTPLPSVLPAGSWVPSTVPYLQSGQFRVEPTAPVQIKATEQKKVSASPDYPTGTTRSGSSWRSKDPAHFFEVEQAPKQSLAARAGSAILGFFIKDAQASPLAASAVATTSVSQAPAAAAATTRSQRWDGFNEPQEQSTRLPVHLEDLLPFFGQGRDDKIEAGRATITLVEQPKPKFDPYITPLSSQSGLLLTQGLLNLYRKGEKSGERLHAADQDKKYVQKPDVLSGFPEAKRAAPKIPYAGKFRPRWGLPDGKILEWDSQHGELEMYDKRGNHIGAFDHNTGKQIKDKKPGRTIKKYL